MRFKDLIYCVLRQPQKCCCQEASFGQLRLVPAENGREAASKWKPFTDPHTYHTSTLKCEVTPFGPG